MFNNEYFKSEGKRKFKNNYWICVLASVIIAFVGSNSGNGIDIDFDEIIDSGINPQSIESTVQSVAGSFLPKSIATVFSKISSMTYILPMLFVIAIIVSIVLAIFVFNIIEVGGARFFIVNAEEREEKAQIGEFLQPFQSGNYLEIVKTQFLRGLYTLLWSLLLLVPGIIKTYEYAMIPYIMADYPEATSKEAFVMSKKMMDGNKLNLFVLDFSFIGWYLLEAITFGIVGVFYVEPYVNATHAEVYRRLKEVIVTE